MVTRQGYLASDQPQVPVTTDPIPPYPVTPTSGKGEGLPPESAHQTSSGPHNASVNLLEDEDLPDWDSSDDEDEAGPQPLPSALRPGTGGSTSLDPSKKDEGLPTSLRIGNPTPLNVTKNGDSGRTSAELYQNVWANNTGSSTTEPMSPSSPTLKSNNPFLKNRSASQSQYSTAQDSTKDNELSQKSDPQYQLPLRTGTKETAVMSQNASGTMTSPFSSQPPLIPYDSEFASNQSQNQPPIPEVTVSSPGSAQVKPYFAKYGSIKSSNPFSGTEDSPETPKAHHDLNDQATVVNTHVQNTAAQGVTDGIIFDDSSLSSQPAVPLSEPPNRAYTPPSPTLGLIEEQPPPRPPRPSEQLPPPKPPRPDLREEHIGGASSSATTQQIRESPQEQIKKQRNETYQIKHIRWRDISVHNNPRQSPILIQNANGPCPLLALVNALVLSTPADLTTALVETLRTREQVSLGLLLDAVFDELMSGRRGGTAQALPDVGELYSFLITLHTGMNVNPRFLPLKREIPNLIDFDDSVPGSVLPPTSKNMGSFESTKELQLYGTFAIPLIHGWLPEPNTSAFEAFKNSAPTYEEAQNILFRQEEIEQKLGSQQLSHDEERMLIDIDSIHQFFNTWPTQLTKYGLEAMQGGLGEGDIAILFRNDHFSTIYKEPRSGALMTLVTDAGYSTHDEIVWESLVDISGTSTEFFAGDFKSVSHEGNTNLLASSSARPNSQGHPRPSSSNNNDYNGAQDALGFSQNSTAVPSANQSLNEPEANRTRTAAEQEDHDLALAIQLQEEEEERERSQRAAARRREEELSQQFLSQDARPEIPPRRSGQAAQRTNRPGTGGVNAPPPYEQAAGGKPFYPPRGHPSSEHAPRRHGYGDQTQTGGSYAGVAGSNAGPSGSGRRRTARQSLADQMPAGGGQQSGRYDDGRDRDKCVMM